MDKIKDLYERLFEFERRIHEFLQTIPHSHDNITIRAQLAKSARLVGVKYDEARSGSPVNDLTNEDMLLKGIRELHYWLRIIKRKLPDLNQPELADLITESGELQNILESIIQKQG
jgi:four helix bundle protein